MRKIKKVPVFMQMEMTECGAASLCMILAYFGKWITLEQARVDCGVGRDGSSATKILKAARNYGLKAQGYRCELDGIKELSFPMIIHWNFNHFVVLCGFKKEKAVICDPARGRVEVSMKEFDDAFTGIVLCFEKTDKFVAGGRPTSVLEFAKRRLKGAMIPLLMVFLISFFVAVVNLATQFFSKIYMDEILTGKNPRWLSHLLLGMIVLLVVQTLVLILQNIYLLKIRGRMAVTANVNFMWHVLLLPVEFFSQRYAGDIASRQESNEEIADTLIAELGPVLLNMVMLILYLGIMARYSLPLTLIGILTCVLNVFAIQYISSRRINLIRVQMKDEGNLVSTTVSGIEMIETIKASGSESGFFEKWSGLSASVNKSRVEFSKVENTIGMIPVLLMNLANILVVIIGAALILKGDLTTGMLLAFQGLLSNFMQPVEEILNMGSSLMEMRTSMERVEDVMQYKTDVSYEESEESNLDETMEESEELRKLSGRMEVKNITFGYSKLSPPLIQNFSMNVPVGGTVALVGASGCGKSTIAKLISGLYQPWDGEILYDGKKRSEIPRMVFTSSLAVVDQDITLFEDSISENIRMWDKSIEDFEIIMAARDAQIHDDILNREGGYHARIKENGKNFSGGQCQRIEIARMLAQDPTIIVLDEATSALDARTEYEVIRSIKERGITCIIVAHRLSTIRDCDEIIVLEDGQVVERGRHEELYAQNGLYTKLISME